MDKNTVTGISLIAIILIASFYFFGPKKSDKPVIVNKVDSSQQLASKKITPADTAKKTVSDTSHEKTKPVVITGWESITSGVKKEYTLENGKLRIRVSNKGGMIDYAELKTYKTSDKKPLVLIDSASHYGYQMPISGQNINTESLYFTPIAQTASSITMAVHLPTGGRIMQTYSLKDSDYQVGYKLVLDSMKDAIPNNINYFFLNWHGAILSNEHDSSISKINTTIHYRNVGESPNYLSETKDDQETFKKPTDWVSFKQQFFCQTLISTEKPFEDAELSTELTSGHVYNKKLKAELTLPYGHNPSETYNMKYYFGPLDYHLLSGMNLDLEHQIPLGWSFFLISWVNRGIIIPVFDFLSRFVSNYGIIILLLALFIKLITLPFTYKSYLSSAKMRVLKPELDELKTKFGKEPTKLQSEQMKLYRKAGVSPFGGCLPLLLQFPILISMYRFFPSSIELRQQGFLWAKDLSTYDSIYTLPFNIPAYGDHVSLFCILMTISTIIYTYVNNQLTPQQSEFKWLSYIMPIFLLGVFNRYAAGLSIYYFFFNILTFVQQAIFKQFIDEKKLIAQIEENKKKPASNKKSRLQQRLEDLQKQQQARTRR